MAEQAQADRKAQLVQELELSRAGLAVSLGGVRQDLNLSAHLKKAIARRKFAWLAGAVVGGLILTRFIFRKKKPVHGEAEARIGQLNQSGRAGAWLSVLGLMVSLLKPAVTNFLSQRLADYATGDGAASGARRYSWR